MRQQPFFLTLRYPRAVFSQLCAISVDYRNYVFDDDALSHLSFTRPEIQRFASLREAPYLQISPEGKVNSVQEK
jgi:hypothetical protein